MILICPEHSFSRPISCRVTRHIPCGFVSRATSAFSPFQAILRKETNIVQKGELQEEVIAKLKSFNREKSIKRAESREKMLDKIDVLDKPVEEKEAASEENAVEEASATTVSDDTEA